MADLRGKMLYAGRWLLGLALLGWLLLRIEWRPIGGILGNVSLPYLAVLVSFSAVLIWVSCLKWKLLLGERGKDVSIATLMSLYLVGYFFSHFFPSQYGGDVVRGYELGRDIDNHAASFGSVFLERFTGLVALMLVSGVTGLFLPDLVRRPEVGLPFLGAWVVFLVILWFLLDQRPLNWAVRRFSAGRFGKAVRAGESLYREIRSSRRDRGVFLKAMALSILFHLLAVVNTWLAIRTIRCNVDFLPLMLVVPIILMVSTVPLTVNSIGLWEGAFVFFLAPLGLASPQALAVALLLRGKQLLQGILGGFVYLVRASRRRR